ncbi:zinc ribbon domain-containing protein [Paenibacillus sp. IB182496]|uniref:Zinc ribbon domain-containing protein n=1 Tax=Paenibacillus sabuli TaxID=2772509 RepID=A0A927BXQ6_9BACL|nr:zinc ribbon domain-containing protein [Paenibacillus sabuli]MBD2847836.1 zinc ribbon domain-containing protein [Paenibacillus sabuli]
MASFFDKMKQGASDAAKRAQLTVETQKLKSQASGKEKEMERVYARIGKAVYESHKAGDISASEAEVMDYCAELEEMETEIERLEFRIKTLKAVKTCDCGKVVAADVKFCPDCGKRFSDEPRQADTTGDIRVICSSCETENDMNAKYCISCGEDLAAV